MTEAEAIVNIRAIFCYETESLEELVHRCQLARNMEMIHAQRPKEKTGLIGWEDFQE